MALKKLNKMEQMLFDCTKVMSHDQLCAVNGLYEWHKKHENYDKKYADQEDQRLEKRILNFLKKNPKKKAKDVINALAPQKAKWGKSQEEKDVGSKLGEMLADQKIMADIKWNLSVWKD